MTTSVNSGEVWATTKIALVWVANYFTLTNLNAVLTTIGLALTIAFTYFQIDKLLRERAAYIKNLSDIAEKLKKEQENE